MRVALLRALAALGLALVAPGAALAGEWEEASLVSTDPPSSLAVAIAPSGGALAVWSTRGGTRIARRSDATGWTQTDELAALHGARMNGLATGGGRTVVSVVREGFASQPGP